MRAGCSASLASAPSRPELLMLSITMPIRMQRPSKATLMTRTWSQDHRTVLVLASFCLLVDSSSSSSCGRTSALTKELSTAVNVASINVSSSAQSSAAADDLQASCREQKHPLRLLCAVVFYPRHWTTDVLTRGEGREGWHRFLASWNSHLLVP